MIFSFLNFDFDFERELAAKKKEEEDQRKKAEAAKKAAEEEEKKKAMEEAEIKRWNFVVSIFYLSHLCSFQAGDDGRPEGGRQEVLWSGDGRSQGDVEDQGAG